MPPYREQLRVPLSWIGTGLGVAGIVAATVHSGASGWRSIAPYAVFLPLTVLGLVLLSRHAVRVEDGVLHVPGARAPLSAFGPAEVLDRDALRERLGVRAQNGAWVQVRPWLRTAVLLPVTDPEDDTPYWLVGTRRPLELALACQP